MKFVFIHFLTSSLSLCQLTAVQQSDSLSPTRPECRTDTLMRDVQHRPHRLHKRNLITVSTRPCSVFVSNHIYQSHLI